MTHDPLDRTELVRRARAALARLDFTGAIEALFKVEHDRETRVLLARAYRNSARPHDARKLLEPLADTSPDAATELGLLELAFGKSDRAHALFTLALEHDDFEGHADAMHGLAYIAEARTRGGERGEVYSLLTRALERHPDHHVLLQTLAIAHLNDGHVAEATEIFAKVIAIRAAAPWAGTRFEVEAHGNMACALVAAGELDEALEAVERAMEVCPDWFRQSMAMMMQADPDLEAIHAHPKFIASMAYRRGGTREERMARAEAAIAEREAGPPPLPDPDQLDSDVRSGDATRRDEACRVMDEIVSAREDIWEDHGWCEDRIKQCAEQIIERSLRDVTWLHDALMQRTSQPTVALAALLAGSHDSTLREVGAPLASTLLERWLLEDGPALIELLETLAWDETRATLPACRDTLVTAACTSSVPAPVRRLVLEALVYQGTAEEAPRLVDLVDDDIVASAAIETIHALDASQLDPAPLLARPSVRYVTALTYTDSLADHFETLLEILAEPRVDHERQALLRKLMTLHDARLVPAVLDESTNEHSTYGCLAWLRSQSLTDEQLARLMGTRFEAKRVAWWLAAVARAQARPLTLDVVSLPALDQPPTEGSAELVGYAGVRERLDWIRAGVAEADRRTLCGIVVALGQIGESQDATLLERLGDRVDWLARPTALSRVLLGEDLSLLDGLVPRTPFDVWALERLVERHGRTPELAAAADRASERGLHNEDLAEFRRVVERLRAC